MTHIREVIPEPIAKMHDELVRYILTTGEDNIVHSRREIFLKNKANFIFRIEVFVDVNAYFPEEMPYIFFIKAVPT